MDANNLSALFIQGLEDSARIFSVAAADLRLLSTLKTVAEEVVETLENGGRLFTCGNGGSAAQATHFSAELVGPFYDRQRPAYAAIPLGFDPSALTAVANDYDYSQVFARQLRGLAHSGDILWGLSTSGNSANVVEAFKAAREIGVTTVLFSNHDGGKAKEFADHVLHTPTCPTPRVQELHLIYGHCLCEAIEAQMVARSDVSHSIKKAA